MNIIEPVILGIVQGLTEFLPVSSSGHLVLVKSFFPSFVFPGVVLEVVLHLGTLFSIVYFFKKEILSMSKNMLLLLLVGSIPAGFVGIFFSSGIESLFASVEVVGYALLVTGVFNLFVDRINPSKKKVSFTDSIFVGVAQAFAIIPGISRSGSTIFWGVLRGVEKKKAAVFSFLLSIPAVMGANLVEFLSYRGEISSFNMSTLAIGFLVSFVTGIFAIKLVLSSLESKKFKYFAYYCFVLGFSVLVFK